MLEAYRIPGRADRARLKPGGLEEAPDGGWAVQVGVLDVDDRAGLAEELR